MQREVQSLQLVTIYPVNHVIRLRLKYRKDRKGFAYSAVLVFFAILIFTTMIKKVPKKQAVPKIKQYYHLYIEFYKTNQKNKDTIYGNRSFNET